VTEEVLCSPIAIKLDGSRSSHPPIGQCKLLVHCATSEVFCVPIHHMDQSDILYRILQMRDVVCCMSPVIPIIELHVITAAYESDDESVEYVSYQIRMSYHFWRRVTKAPSHVRKSNNAVLLRG
jgi:hypothetical protein